MQLHYISGISCYDRDCREIRDFVLFFNTESYTKLENKPGSWVSLFTGTTPLYFPQLQSQYAVYVVLPLRDVRALFELYAPLGEHRWGNLTRHNLITDAMFHTE